MDDYIFLIIAIVVTILAAVKKNKKKANAVSPAQQPEQPTHFLFDQLLPEETKAEFDDDFDFPDWPSSEAPREPVPEPVKIQEQPKAYFIPRETFKSHLPVKKTIIESSVKKIVPAEEEMFEEEETSGFLEDFSLRKAVIYSEILKPKFEGGRTTLF